MARPYSAAEVGGARGLTPAAVRAGASRRLVFCVDELLPLFTLMGLRDGSLFGMTEEIVLRRRGDFTIEAAGLLAW